MQSISSLVLFEDNHCLAVAKPAPLATQAPPGIVSLETLVKEYFRERYGKKGNVYLGVPHRLDRPVSGIVLLARTTKAAQRLTEQFQNRQVGKVYWGAVEGTVAPGEGVWEDWVRKVKDEPRSERVDEGTPGAQQARLRYRTLQPCDGGVLVEFVPETGRMHQIRIQAASRGWPIRGDSLYGAKLPFGPQAELPRDRIIALHGRTLTFLHPIRYEPITLTAPLPAAWRELGTDLVVQAARLHGSVQASRLHYGTMMISEATLEHVLATVPRLTIAVLGDLFLDRYLDLDAALTEPSLETGLDAYQVARVRSYPGAAGTVINNLAAVGVGAIVPITVIGDDGEGYELRQALRALPALRQDHVHVRGDRRTPTYTKPMLCEPGKPPRELNRLDIKNRAPFPKEGESTVLHALKHAWPQCDALLVLDQVSEPECGVVTSRIRELLAELGSAHPDKLILADSRERIGQFAKVCLKPNLAESRAALGRDLPADEAAGALARRCERAVFCTCGEMGIYVARPDQQAVLVPAMRVSGPIDSVGAGDSISAGLACALASGTSLEEAAGFANLVASITIQQIGTTGTASPQQLRQRRRESMVGASAG